VVGLGVGTIAAYQRPLDSLVYFEVDRAIVDLAEDPRYFSYLAEAPRAPRIVLGDGRLSLAEEPADSFDVLVLDAFSSDAVPAHLLTREALQAYARVLRPHGLIVFHLTNRHFDLVPAVASAARSLGLEARARDYTPSADEREELAAQPSRWLVIGASEDVGRFDEREWTDPSEGPILTDDFSDVMWLLRWR
jgi:spermidine synthase